MSVSLAPEQARLDAAISRSEVARRLGLTLRTVSRYQDGERIPSAATLARMAEVYGVGDLGAGRMARWYAEARP